MSGTSKKTTLITLRLQNDVIEILKRREEKSGYTVRDQLTRRIEYDTRRSHKRTKNGTSL